MKGHIMFTLTKCWMRLKKEKNSIKKALESRKMHKTMKIKFFISVISKKLDSILILSY